MNIDIKDLPQNIYYCAVQALDTSFKASSFISTVSDSVICHPVFTPGNGYSSLTPFSVTISCPTDSTSIYYTLDGSIPSDNSILYTDSIRVNTDITIKAIAYKQGYLPSDVATANYRIVTFEEQDISLLNVGKSACTWCDVDRDHDMDLILTGANLMNYPTRELYLNNEGNLSEYYYNNIMALGYGSIDIGDVNNDNLPDLALVGWPGGSSISYIMTNTPNELFSNTYSLSGAYESTTSFVDFDNNGTQDLFLSGDDDENRVSYFFKNTQGSMSIFDPGIVPLRYSSCCWGDYDNDGYVDLFLSGENGAPMSLLYHNENNSLTLVNTNIDNVWAGSSAWVDYDNDGDLDLFICGRTDYTDNPVPISKIYKNDNGNFVDIDAHLDGVWFSSCAWADYDNDGDLDLLISGCQSSLNDNVTCTELYQNNNGIFSKTNSSFPGLWHGSCSWADYDNDGDLDLLISGNTIEHNCVTKLYKNLINNTNSAPSAPSNLNLSIDNGTGLFSWNPSTDDTTPSEGLTYNLCVGTTPNGCEILSALSDTSGYHYVNKIGNAQNNCFLILKDLPATTIYWSVQAIDHSFKASRFTTTERTNSINEPTPLTTKLITNYPNPFNPTTSISYSLAKDSDVEISIYNMKGQLVKTLVKAKQEAGNHVTTWNGRNSDNNAVSSGLYFYKMKTNSYTKVNKMLMLK